MKKGLLIGFLMLVSFQIGFSQQEEQFEELQKQMEQMQRQLFEQFGNLDFNDSGLQFFMDTMIIDLGDTGTSMEPFPFDNPQLLNDLFSEMQKQLSEMDEEDWAEIEKLFESFGGNGFMLPFPPSLTPPKEEEQTIIGKKKRKTYKL